MFRFIYIHMVMEVNITYSILRHRIDAASIERVAAQDSPDCHKPALDNTVFVDRLVTVVRTARVEPACILG